MRRLFAILAFTGFGLSAAIHLLTFFGFDWVSERPHLWVALFLLAISFVAVVFSRRARREPAPQLRPHPLVVTSGCLAAYAALNFVVSLGLLGGGVPQQQGDTYKLTSHGAVLRDLTPTEYRWHRAYQTRLASGHLMFFFFAAGAALTVSRSGKSRSKGLFV